MSNLTLDNEREAALSRAERTLTLQGAVLDGEGNYRLPGGARAQITDRVCWRHVDGEDPTFDFTIEYRFGER